MYGTLRVVVGLLLFRISVFFANQTTKTPHLKPRLPTRIHPFWIIHITFLLQHAKSPKVCLKRSLPPSTSSYPPDPSPSLKLMTVYFPMYCKPGQICKFAICVAGFAHPDNTVLSVHRRIVLPPVLTLNKISVIGDSHTSSWWFLQNNYL